MPAFKNNCAEAGLDEAGRGCLAGPVFAAAVILPPGFVHDGLRDSKKLSARQRDDLRKAIEDNALAWSVQQVDEATIDRINILKASVMAMNLAIDHLSVVPEHLAIDGNYFRTSRTIQYKTIIKGDDLYQNIAAASILAKTHRDAWMKRLHDEFPAYDWASNKGYGTRAHVSAIKQFGLSPYHRRSFQVKSLQIPLFQHV